MIHKLAELTEKTKWKPKRKIAVAHKGIVSEIAGNVIFLKTIRHSAEKLSQLKKICDQYEFHKNIIYNELKNAEIRLDLTRIIVGREGIARIRTKSLMKKYEDMDFIVARLGEGISMVVDKGGLHAYTGFNNACEVEKAAQAGDKKCHDVMEAMAENGALILSEEIEPKE